MLNESRKQRFQARARSGNAPATYHRNSAAEDEVLAACRTFEQLYYKFFPDRKPLLLTALNECNQNKPICTFVRPTALPYDELFNLEGCCKYVAGYVAYEPLHNAALYADPHDSVELLPRQVASPATALEWQAANCLETSLILVSLLRGIGYNAYVVNGYARSSVCLNDQSERMWTNDVPTERNSDDDEVPLEELDGDYLALMKGRPLLRRVSDADPWKAAISDSVAAENGESGASRSQADAKNEAAEYQVKPAHCWVVVLPGGRRSLKQASFVEPSVGEMIGLSAADEFYLGIESIFNEKSYYVNLRSNAPVSVVSFDLKDPSQWESLFFVPPETEEKDNLAATFAASGRRGMADSMAASTASGAIVSSGSATLSGRIGPSIPRSWVSELTLTPLQYASRYPGKVKVLHYANATIKLFAEYSQTDNRVKEVRVPDSVFSDLEQVHILYAYRLDKLHRRTVLPQPAFAQDRGSNLDDSGVRKRSWAGAAAEHSTASAAGAFSGAPAYRLLWEWYDVGRMRGAVVEGLREFIHEPGKQRTLRFYWRSREDGLARRDEFFYDAHALRKVKETYRGRVDRLCCRSATFERPRTVREANSHDAIVNPGTATGLKDFPRLEPIRMSQKYERAPNVAPEKDVAKIKFIRPQGGEEAGEMWVFFHYNEDSITRPYHMFAKGSSKVEDYITSSAAQKVAEPPMKIVTKPGQAPPSDLELFNERKWLNGMESDCLAEIRAKMDEHLNVLLAMERDHTVVQVALSAYDTLRNRPKETEVERAQKLAEAMRREESRKDYLAPYIAKLDMPSAFDGNYLSVRLTAEQAKQVRDEALTELKERLIQRGQIMQSRMNKEKEDFNKRQAQYQKNADADAVDGGKEAEEFAKYCKEATWRMKVLDERLSKHIDHASEKYAALAQRLSEDERLTALYDD